VTHSEPQVHLVQLHWLQHCKNSSPKANHTAAQQGHEVSLGAGRGNATVDAKDTPVEPRQVQPRLSTDQHSLIGQHSPSLAEGLPKKKPGQPRDYNLLHNYRIATVYLVYAHKNTVSPEPCFIVDLGK
jgi:hypothetical protein